MQGKTGLLRFLLIALTFVTACGGGGGGGSSTPATQHPPVISNFIISPSNASLNQGGGAVSMTLYFNVFDSGGDIATATLNVYNVSTGLQTYNGSTALNIPPGTTSTTTSIITAASTTVARTARLEIYVTDAGGSPSNKLTGTFTVQ